jgi:hypothetical protein
MTTKKKTPEHLWKAGQSGNPKGRPAGAGEIAKLRAGIAEHVPAIIQTLTTAALAGDVGAARLLLERVIPAIKASEEAAPVNLPDGTLTEQGRAVVAAVAAGEIAPGQGASIMGSLGALQKLAQGDEMEARIAALEAISKQPKAKA